MGRVVIQNIYGADIVVESKCCICGKEHTYRLKERKVCSDDKCYEESKKRRDKQFNK